MPARPNKVALRTVAGVFLALGAGSFPAGSQPALPPGIGTSSAEPAVMAAPPPVPPGIPRRDLSVPRGPGPSSSPTPVAAEELVGQAGEHFLAGKERFQRGDLEGARREFDRTVDDLLAAREVAPDRQLLEKTFDDLLDAIHHYDLEALGAEDQREETPFDKSPLEEMLGLTFPIDPRLKDKVKEELRVTLSELPLTVNDAVLSYVNYFSSERGRRTMAAGLHRAARYRSLVSRILAEEGVPQEMMQLAQAESGFYPRAISRKSAAGMWQFVLLRGREYGLLRTLWYDDRLDPEKATRAAARHLRDLYQEFGDWYLAMAAYNCGPLTVERAVERTGFADFWELRNRRVLPRETCNYVPVILAMVIVAKNARDYGLGDIQGDAPLEYDTIAITAPTHLALIADAAERPITEIRELNPALLRSVASAGYHLRLPKGCLGKTVAALEAVPANRRASWRIHRVGQGETLASIARRYAVTTGSIASANPSGGGSTDPGDVLLIPAVYREATALTSARSRRHVTRGRTSVPGSSPIQRPAGKPASSAHAKATVASARSASSPRTPSAVRN